MADWVVEEMNEDIARVQQQREEEEISDHVISIEENGHITIEQVFNPIS